MNQRKNGDNRYIRTPGPAEAGPPPKGGLKPYILKYYSSDVFSPPWGDGGKLTGDGGLIIEFNKLI
jgi:hypothetical protein